MPTIRRRSRRMRKGAGGFLTERQYELLIHGCDLLRPGPLVPVGILTQAEIQQFSKEQETSDFPDGAAATWRRHRAQLMQDPELPAGTRPWGFWRFDLGLDPVPTQWFDEIQVLLDKALIISEEALRIEQTWDLLNPAQSPQFCASLETGEGIQRMGLSAGVLLGLAREFECASRFHQWRGRPELAAKYADRARECNIAHGKAT